MPSITIKVGWPWASVLRRSVSFSKSWRFPKSWGLQIINFHRIFHVFNQLDLGDPPWLWKPPSTKISLAPTALEGEVRLASPMHLARPRQRRPSGGMNNLKLIGGFEARWRLLSLGIINPNSERETCLETTVTNIVKIGVQRTKTSVYYQAGIRIQVKIEQSKWWSTNRSVDFNHNKGLSNTRRGPGNQAGIEQKNAITQCSQ
jgi:hypothetical protein